MSDISLFGKIDINQQTIISGAWNLNTRDFILINHMILLFKRYIYLRRRDRHGPNITDLKLFIKNINKQRHLFTIRNGRNYCLSYRTVSLMARVNGV